jgi:hypothetical protein
MTSTYGSFRKSADAEAAMASNRTVKKRNFIYIPDNECIGPDVGSPADDGIFEVNRPDAPIMPNSTAGPMSRI